MTEHWVILRTAGLLFLSNCFMTAAWYGHLKFKNASMLVAIVASWMLALPEYSLQIPANRLGYGKMTAYQLKILQECITLVVFMIFARLVLGEAPSVKYLISFLMVIGAVMVAFS